MNAPSTHKAYTCSMNAVEPVTPDNYAGFACMEEFDTAVERATHQALVHPLQFADKIRRAVDTVKPWEKAQPSFAPDPREDDQPEWTPAPGGNHNTRKAAVTPEVRSSDDVPAEPMTEIEAIELVQARFRSDKLEVADVTPRMVAFATQWAASWQGGDFQFMVDMRANAKRGRLSVGMAKGVWNCLRAEVLRNERIVKQAVAPVAPKDDYVPVKFDVHVVDGEYYRIHISQSTGNPYACKWDGSGFDYAQGAIRKLSGATLINAEQAAAFGHANHKCCFCGRAIDTPESEAVGYGPKCAADKGLPWGTHTH